LLVPGRGWAERRARIDESSVQLVAVDCQCRFQGIPSGWPRPGIDALQCSTEGFRSARSKRCRVFHGKLEPAGDPQIDKLFAQGAQQMQASALDDALTAWRFLQAQGIAPAQIAVGGDSAGGGLTAALINHLRAAGEEQPACAWLLSPWTDLTMSGPSLATKDAVDPLIHKDYLEQLVRAYLPKGFDRKDPRVSPLYSSLRGFPPTLVQVGSDETLIDDSVRFVGAAGSADVAVTLEIWPHMITRGSCGTRIQPGRLALASAGAFMRRYITTDCASVPLVALRQHRGKCLRECVRIAGASAPTHNCRRAPQKPGGRRRTCRASAVGLRVGRPAAHPAPALRASARVTPAEPTCSREVPPARPDSWIVVWGPGTRCPTISA
jgi:hypothetical protein